MELLNRLLPNRDFALPQFDLVPLEFDEDSGEGCDELLLDTVVESIGQADIVPLVQHNPTPGELQASIERHLHRSKESAPPMDPADELRNALADLRRSLA